jgi:hypothetical protein
MSSMIDIASRLDEKSLTALSVPLLPKPQIPLYRAAQRDARGSHQLLRKVALAAGFSALVGACMPLLLSYFLRGH